MYNFSEANIERLIIHAVGNPMQDGELILSSDLAYIPDAVAQELLMQYFLSPFKPAELYRFKKPEDGANSAIEEAIDDIFVNPTYLEQGSKTIARLLFEATNHPNIKNGKLCIVYFENVWLNDNLINAVGIFKTESISTFIDFQEQRSNYKIDYNSGIDIKKLDKGVLVFDIYQSEGYAMAIIDKTNKKDQAQYWTSNFLKAELIENAFYHTEHYLKICKGFVDNVFNPSHNVARTEQIELCNRTIQYFEQSEEFDIDSFEQLVLGGNQEVAEAFNEYRREYEFEHGVLPLITYPEFDISPMAVKASKRLFKNLLVLDKNFQVSITGKKDNIEQGFDEEKNMKFYKLYYKEEK